MYALRGLNTVNESCGRICLFLGTDAIRTPQIIYFGSERLVGSWTAVGLRCVNFGGPSGVFQGYTKTGMGGFWGDCSGLPLDKSTVFSYIT